MTLFAVIMAGGGGTRLWPVSRHSHPKQSLRILGDRTLFQATVDRLVSSIPADRILVATLEEYADRLRQQTPEIPPENFLLEPEPKGTASVIGLAAVEIRSRQPDAVMACLPADHFIGQPGRFQAALAEAAEIAAKGFLVALGVKPTAPETGYGYLEAGPALQGFGPFPAAGVKSFKEKPSAAVAAKYVEGGQYNWNAGIFIWSAEAILKEIERWMPDLGMALAEISARRDQPDFELQAVWGRLKPQTIDYGVMEHSERTAMVAVEGLDWWDVGSWDRLLEVLPGDPQGNVILAPNVELMDATGNLVYQVGDGSAARLLALIGVEDLVVVDAGDTFLMASRGQAQKVRDLVQRLADAGEDRYL